MNKETPYVHPWINPIENENEITNSNLREGKTLQSTRAENLKQTFHKWL